MTYVVNVSFVACLGCAQVWGQKRTTTPPMSNSMAVGGFTVFDILSVVVDTSSSVVKVSWPNVEGHGMQSCKKVGEAQWTSALRNDSMSTPYR
jgi:hypothetical protein